MSIKLKNNVNKIIVIASKPKNIMLVPDKETDITENQYNVIKQLSTFERYVNKDEITVSFGFDTPELETVESKGPAIEQSVEEITSLVDSAIKQKEAEVEAEAEKPKRKGRKKRG